MSPQMTTIVICGDFFGSYGIFSLFFVLADWSRIISYGQGVKVNHTPAILPLAPSALSSFALPLQTLHLIMFFN